nr:2OG-Fe(II) oxygenase [Brevundimonas sp.]
MPGDPAPMFKAASASNPNYALDTAAGRYLVLAIPGRAEGEVRAALDLAAKVRARFDDVHASFFGIVPDTPEWREACQDQLPGVRWLFDAEGRAAELYGVGEEGRWALVDPTLRIVAIAGAPGAERLLEEVGRLPPPDLHAGPQTFAPVLAVPRIFEPAFCKALIDHYEAEGGEPSGFMREVDGVTRLMMDDRHKRRSDVHLEDGDLKSQARARILRRLVPQIEKAFQYKPTRMERYLIGCYEADSGGWFRPHRDNTTKGTAHRRFAVSINLNSDFDGGDLRFPEYGSRTYRPTVGGAVVFSCSLLHEATPVTKGRRFAFLPFLYDEEAAKIREANAGFLEPGLGEYRAGAAS